MFYTLLTWNFLPSCTALILYMSEGVLSELLYIHIVDIETFDLHALILCVSEGFLSELLCIHILDIETFVLHALILCLSEGLLCKLLCIHIVGFKYFLKLHSPKSTQHPLEVLCVSIDCLE